MNSVRSSSVIFVCHTFVECNKDNLSILRKHASVLAEIEGLDAHKISMDIRKCIIFGVLGYDS